MMGSMTRVGIVGGHGKVAQQVMRILYDRGDEFVGLVRDQEQADDVYRLGGEGVLIDIEATSAAAVADAFQSVDAIVFAAGAGGGSGVERKQTVDYAGSVLSAEAARLAGIQRFIQVSAMGVDKPVAADADPQWAAYVEAKRDADRDLRATSLDWTILRPGGLTFAPGTGLVELGDEVPRGSISREDVGALIVAVIDDPRTIHQQWEAVSGTLPIEEEIARRLVR